MVKIVFRIKRRCMQIFSLTNNMIGCCPICLEACNTCREEEREKEKDKTMKREPERARERERVFTEVHEDVTIVANQCWTREAFFV